VLGYVKCEPGEMLVKHYRLYQAIYCGLCHSIRKNASVFLLPFLSYDFVFLAALRLYLSGEEGELEKQNCLFHPAAKKQRMKDNRALSDSAKASLLLTVGKMEDDLLDRDGALSRRLAIRLVLPFLRRALSRLQREDPGFCLLSESITAFLKEGRELEKRNAGLDDMCSNFAELLSVLVSFGFEGNQKRILSGIGDLLGRWIYTVDALDDWERDETSGAFNPLVASYGKKSQAQAHFPQIDLVLSYYVERMKSVLDLAEGSENLRAICENILCCGLPAAVRGFVVPTIGEKR